jgi:hypothetical protein
MGLGPCGCGQRRGRKAAGGAGLGRCHGRQEPTIDPPTADETQRESEAGKGEQKS